MAAPNITIVEFLRTNVGYQRYIAQRIRPVNIPIAEPNAEGCYEIYPGEIFCRMPDESEEDGICHHAKCYTKTGNLTTHISSAHPWATIVRPTGRLTHATKRSAHRWYNHYFGMYSDIIPEKTQVDVNEDGRVVKWELVRLNPKDWWDYKDDEKKENVKGERLESKHESWKMRSENEVKPDERKLKHDRIDEEGEEDEERKKRRVCMGQE